MGNVTSRGKPAAVESEGDSEKNAVESAGGSLSNALSLAAVPEDIMVHILSFASIRDIGRMALCCKEMAELLRTRGEEIWLAKLVVMGYDRPQGVQQNLSGLTCVRAVQHTVCSMTRSVFEKSQELLSAGMSWGPVNGGYWRSERCEELERDVMVLRQGLWWLSASWHFYILPEEAVLYDVYARVRWEEGGLCDLSFKVESKDMPFPGSHTIQVPTAQQQKLGAREWRDLLLFRGKHLPPGPVCLSLTNTNGYKSGYSLDAAYIVPAGMPLDRSRVEVDYFSAAKARSRMALRSVEICDVSQSGSET